MIEKKKKNILPSYFIHYPFFPKQVMEKTNNNSPRYNKYTSMKLLHCTHTHTKQAPAFKSEVKSSSMKYYYHIAAALSSLVEFVHLLQKIWETRAKKIYQKYFWQDQIRNLSVNKHYALYLKRKRSTAS